MTNRTSDLQVVDHEPGSMDPGATPGNGGRASVASAIGSAGGTVRRAVDEAATAVPDALAGSRDAIDRAATALRREPEPTLLAGMTFLAGLGVGLVVAGAPRLLTLATLAPAVAFGSALFGRRPPYGLRAEQLGS